MTMPPTVATITKALPKQAFQHSKPFGLNGHPLAWLEKRPLAELLAKDIFGNDVPQIAMTRTWAERLDTATLVLTDTAMTLLSSLLVPRMLRHAASWLSGISVKDLAAPVSKETRPATPLKLARLAVAFGFAFPFASAFLAVPLFRNWLTMKRTQSGDFESMIGFNKTAKHATLPSPQANRSLQEKQDEQKNRALRILLIGASFGSASLIALSMAARRLSNATHGSVWENVRQFLEQRHPKSLETLFTHFDLQGKQTNELAPGAAQLLFWGLPAYSGWIHASRSKNERRERTIQAFNGIFWFFCGGKLTGTFFKHAYAKQQAAQPDFWRKEFLEKIADQPLPDSNWRTHFEANPAWRKRLRDSLEDLSYAEIEAHALDNTSKAYQNLVKLKTQKFAISGLATPIIALALVQGLNFYITARKLNQGALNQEALPLPSSKPINPSLKNASAPSPFVSSAFFLQIPSSNVGPKSLHPMVIAHSLLNVPTSFPPFRPTIQSFSPYSVTMPHANNAASLSPFVSKLNKEPPQS